VADARPDAITTFCTNLRAAHLVPRLERQTGIPVYDNGEAGEQLTPLAAAMLSTLVKEFGRMPAMRLAAQGWGAGTGMRPSGPLTVPLPMGRGEALRCARPS